MPDPRRWTIRASVQPGPVPFSRFFAEQAPPVLRFLRGAVGSNDAEECLQETFLAALRAYDGFDGANPRGWALTIARRKAIDMHRARARRPDPVADLGDELAAPAGPGTGGDGGEIWGLVRELPHKQRAAVVLRFSLDLSHREIGEVLECSEAAARRSLHEAMTKLRRQPIEEVA